VDAVSFLTHEGFFERARADYRAAHCAAPIATGAIVAVTHSFAGAFFLAGTLLIAGIASYVFLLGDIAPIPDPPAKTAP
jgi:hypothetical protein